MISSVSITVAITFAVLSLLLHLHRQPPPPIDPTTNNVVVNETITKSPMKTKSNYIVRFNGYKNAQDHRLYLEHSLELVTGWSWVDRNNAAAAFPTDFGLVAIENGVESMLKVELEKLGLVKDVNIDLSYDRSTLRYTLSDYERDREWKREREKDRKKCGSFVDGKKREGKIFTSMSFSEEDGEEHKERYESEHMNSTISWRRKLMMQVRFRFRVSVSFISNVN